MIDFNNPAEVNEYIQELVKNKNPLRHENYQASKEHAEEMGVHINGDSPGALLDDYRPNESTETHEYRLKIYQPITKSKAKKVINVISRIKNSKNFKIVWKEDRPRPNLISDENSLEVYTTKKFPLFKSFQEWVFTVVLKQDLADPNAVIAWRPVGTDESDFRTPFGFIFQSEDVWDYKVDEYYTLLTKEKSLVQRGKEMVLEGNVINVYTRSEILEFRQVGKIEKKIYEISVLFKYDWDIPPVVRMKGEYVEDTFFLYESFISGILPFWNDAIREYSDKQATFVNHVFPERVEMEVECTNEACKGGKVTLTAKNEDGNTKVVVCSLCGGSGWVQARSPFTNVTVRHKKALDENDPVFPGVEYIQKDTASTELLVKDIQNLITDGFAALNMEFLSDVPLNQSGKAKEVDRMELSSFLQQISDNLFEIKRKSYFFINLWRYGTILNEKELEENLPEIIKPTSFDLVTSDDLIAKINAVKESSPQVASMLESDLTEKQFPNDPDKRNFAKAVQKLDPMPNMTLEDKNMAFQAKTVTQEDFIISVNIVPFVRRLIEENEDFFNLKLPEKMELLKTLANVVIQKTQSDTGAPPDGDGQVGGQLRDQD